jgi:hypothetical protein
MKTEGRDHRPVLLSTLVAMLSLVAGFPVLGQAPESPAPAVQANAVSAHAYLPESVRTSIRKAVIIGRESPPQEEISGSYRKETPGLVGGMNEGSRLGTISQEIGGVNVNFPVPILTIPGAIFGGLSGAAQREMQAFRDGLTKELSAAENTPLTNEGLALDVYQELGRLSSPETKLFAPSVPIPDDTDAILFVSFEDVGIDVDGDAAVLAVSAKATVRDPDDGLKIYDTVVAYEDRDTLKNWTANGNALWNDYANFAAHYLAREITAVLFARVEPAHRLQPIESRTVSRVKKNAWHGISKSTTPTLAWQLLAPADAANPAIAGAGEADIYYDVEVYDNHRLVYSQRQVPNPEHTLSYEIDACQTYRWSVRPSYRIDGVVRYGEWMRFRPEPGAREEAATPAGNGNVGRKASEAPAYIQDFAQLQIKC